MSADRPMPSAASMECGKCRRTFTVDEFFDHECPPTSAALNARGETFVETWDRWGREMATAACPHGDPTCPCQACGECWTDSHAKDCPDA